ncbi:MAG: type II toxin-antitoxin system PemK/MazF family toxin [Patescibacteria group bacterium]
MHKDFDTWNNRKKDIQTSEFVAYVHEREIWWCSLGINIGYEQDGKNDLFERPVLILKKFNRSVVMVVPLTSKVKEDKFHYIFEHDGKQFAVILSQLRLISTKRLTRKIRKINEDLFEDIKLKTREVCL